MNHLKTALIAMLCVLIAIQSYDAYQVRTAENNAMAINSANISLTQAIIIAEQHIRGKAASADYEHSQDGRIYKINVLSYATLFDVVIDADNGLVISSIENKPDDDES